MSLPPKHKTGLRAVALFEAFKGLLAVAAGCGALTFLGKDVEWEFERFVHRTHVNPAWHITQVFQKLSSHLDDVGLWLLAGLAAAYATIRFTEAYGLWHERRWAEWLAALGGGLYIPYEIYLVSRRPNLWGFATLIVNLLVVAYMVWLLSERRRQEAAQKQARAQADLTED